ncbi:MULTISPECIES: Asr1405/Asl0597 family protein [unclassified Microcystis]|uniref:Asr1405/Asl0597 family protein n=1 Tax=unclassified Microcystis TaxID=2643300 RepID=UPI002588FD8E|nr:MULTISPECIES: Asr1405/Asl0597 family protein [unclassified Microcystis]
MSIDKLPSEGEKIFPLSAWESWQLYHRLQVLDIECKCLLHKLLQVCIAGPAQLLQLWSVLRQLEASRGCLIDWLETCCQA